MAVNISAQPSKFECVAVCIASRQSTCLIIMLYCTGPITANFFVKLVYVLDRLSTYLDPIILAGDMIIHLEHVSDPITVEFSDLLASYDLVQHVTGAMHDAGGTIVIVCTCVDLPPPSVDIDIGLSDHRLLRWSLQLH